MQNPIETKGYWWLPDSAQKRLPGTLTYSQEDGGFLELVGVFSTERTAQIEQPTIILGITQQGKPVTLYKCFYTQWTYPLTGLGGGRYRVSLIFEGIQFDSEEKIKFHQLCGSYTDLDAWVDIYGFTIERDNIDGNSIFKIRYEKPASQFFDTGGPYEVGIGFSSRGPNLSIVQTEVQISQSTCLVIKSKNGDVSFDELFAQLNVFSCLLQVAVQRVPYPISIFGFSEQNSQELDGKEVYFPEINIYYEPIEPIRNLREKLPQEMLFTFRDLGVEQINAWFGSFNKYQTAIHLYRPLFYSNRLFIDTKFLSIVQALESLHSIMFDNQYLAHDKFVKQRERVLEVVPDDLVEWIETALNSANYKRFTLKIHELLVRKKELLNQCVDDMDSFAKRVKDTRNEFVHHSRQKRTFQTEELPSAIDLLTMLFEAYLLEIIGFSDEKVRELLGPKIRSHQTGWKQLRSRKK